MSVLTLPPFSITKLVLKGYDSFTDYPFKYKGLQQNAEGSDTRTVSPDPRDSDLFGALYIPNDPRCNKNEPREQYATLSGLVQTR